MFRSVCAVVLLSFAASVEAEATTLLLLNKKDATLSFVDPGTLKSPAPIPVGPDPHEIVVSTDGKTAFISNYGGGKYNTLTVVDIARRKVTGKVDLGALRGPHGLAFAAGKVWFTAEVASAVGRYDPATKSVDWIMGTGQRGTHMIHASNDAKTVVATSFSGTASILRPKDEKWSQTIVPAGPGAEGFDVTSDGKEAWVANGEDGSVTVVDIEANKAVATIPAKAEGANRLKISPDGKTALIASLSTGQLFVLDVAKREVTKRLELGKGCAGILFQPDGARAFVACSKDDKVVVIDLASLEVKDTMKTGKDPDGLAWVP